jgi:phosphoribosylcarboxyaminoimidazole (NCAIR) mutase
MTAGAKVCGAAVQAGGHRIVIISAKAGGTAASRPGLMAYACRQPAVASRIHSKLVSS